VFRAICQHHEFADGSGYPRRLLGSRISLTGSLVCAANQVDLLVTKGLTPEEADTLYWHGIAFFHYHANTIANIEELRPAERKAFEGTLKMQYASPLVADWYQYNSVGLDQDAVQFIDRLLLQK
jgi:hypothetical protein